MAVMPFSVIATEGAATQLSLYNAEQRAAYDYKFDAENGAWAGTLFNAKRDLPTTGWLLEGEKNSTVRFKGDNYTENRGLGKNIELQKFNFNDPWTSSSDKGNKFTHKENMSWNLFGSPYLCAMNYSDLLYGRVMYGYQDGAYITLNTISEDTEGYIPAGDAVFTQTVTLRESETVAVKQPGEDNLKSGQAYQGSMNMTVSLSRSYTRAAEDGYEDRLQMTAVPASESRSDFDVNSDGVKWMSADKPQVYALQGDGRYSLLSAVNIEGELNIGVTLPEAGMYTFSIPEDCNRDEYETVVLKDKETGKMVDLLEGNYDFSVAGGGEVTARFTISFNRMADRMDDSTLRIYSPAKHTVRLEGLQPNDAITVYSLSGVALAGRIASSSAIEQFSIPSDIVIVEVIRNGNSIVRKVRL